MPNILNWIIGKTLLKGYDQGMNRMNISLLYSMLDSFLVWHYHFSSRVLLLLLNLRRVEIFHRLHFYCKSGEH